MRRHRTLDRRNANGNTSTPPDLPEYAPLSFRPNPHIEGSQRAHFVFHGVQFLYCELLCSRRMFRPASLSSGEADYERAEFACALHRNAVSD